MKLKDKVVFITDGASKTGPAIVEKFRAEGAILAVNQYPSGAASFTHADPRSKKEIDAAVQSVLDKYGRIDVLVHNNNHVVRANLEDCSDEIYDEELEINAKSAFLYVQAAGLSMKRAKKGSFVFISSIHDEKPNGAAFAYSIAKGAVKMLVREMVLDLGPFNIRTNIVNLGPMEGDDQLFYSDISPLYEHTRERIPNEVWVRPEEAAEAALFFACDDCPSANGGEIHLDGGFLLSYFSRRKNPFLEAKK